MTPRPVLAAWALVLQRDLRLAFRRPGQVVQPLAFFAVVIGVNLIMARAASATLADPRTLVAISSRQLSGSL